MLPSLMDAPDKENMILLGSTTGSWDRDYYLYPKDGTVWCFESPNNPYSKCHWGKISSEDQERIKIESKSLISLIEERKPKLRF